MKYIERDFPIERLNEIAKKEGNAKKPIYMIHKWWARRLGSVFRMILLTSFLEWEDMERASRKKLGIGEKEALDGDMEKLVREKMEELLWEKFYSKNDFGGKTVLDPFMGGGTTIVESLRLGLKPIGIDINPVAWFVTKKEVEPLDFEAFEEEFKKLEKSVGEKIKPYYKTCCPLCEKAKNRDYEWNGESDELADVMYVFWVNKVKCLNPQCKKDVLLFPSFKIATKKSGKGITHTVFCPKCRRIFDTEKDDTEIRCPDCDFGFTPSSGYVGELKNENKETMRKGGEYSCPHCGQNYKVLDSVRRSEKITEREIYAVEYFCSVHGRGYKRVDEYDIELFEKAKKELEGQVDELIGKYIPVQEILDGYNTKQAKNYNYRYFYEMFNERQLLCLSMLLREILKIENENLREFMVIAFSDCLDFNNMFCRYNTAYSKIQEAFSRHVYWPTNMPTENNVWGTKVGAGTFVKYYNKVVNGKKYQLSPFEIKVEGAISDKIQIHDAQLDGSELYSQTSEDISFINHKIDAVITDPPYYDNVMYSELADFFYVWLRLVLKDRYPWFKGEYSRNKREIIKNEIQNKDEEFFLKGIKRVLSECDRVLNDEGLMVFTFHHKETEAWASMLNPVLDAGFYIDAVYPIHSEMASSMHIINKKSISYDTIIVCRKRIEEPQEISWSNLKIQIYAKTKEMIERLLKTRPYLGEDDVKVVAMGKGLELYSKHYPKVLYKEGYLEARDATFLMDELVDQIIEEVKASELPSGLDDISKIYMGYLLDAKYVDYDFLNKLLRSKNFDVRALEDEKIIEKEKKNEYMVMGSAKRYEFIQGKINQNEDLLYIDKIHYLVYLYRRNKPIVTYLSKWKDEILSMTLRLYYEKTRDEDVKNIMDMLEKTTETRKAPTLEEFA